MKQVTEDIHPKGRIYIEGSSLYVFRDGIFLLSLFWTLPIIGFSVILKIIKRGYFGNISFCWILQDRCLARFTWDRGRTSFETEWFKVLRSFNNRRLIKYKINKVEVLRVFQSRLLGWLLGYKGDDEVLHNLYYSPHIIGRLNAGKLEQGLWHAWESWKTHAENARKRNQSGYLILDRQ
jgi:hypothetical protein